MNVNITKETNTSLITEQDIRNIFSIWVYCDFADIFIEAWKKIFYSTNAWLEPIDSEYVANEVKRINKEELNSAYEAAIKKFKYWIITQQEIKTMLLILFWWNKDSKMLADLTTSWSANFSYSFASKTAHYWKYSFRLNAFKHNSWLWIIARVLPEKEFPYEQLWLPSAMKERVLNEKQWLVVVTWPTWSWKTTTLISMISILNRVAKKHIITLEDPIEFVYPVWTCLITQREIWDNTASFHQWLIDALRQAPNILVIWELRDKETIKIAVDAALTWHLVFATFHAWSAMETIEWIIERWWGWDIKHSLSECLVAICAQKMIRYKDIKTWAFKKQTAIEYLWKNQAVESLIKWPKEQLKQVNSELLKSPNISLENSLFKMVFEWKISYSMAFNNMKNKVKRIEDFISKIKNYIYNNSIDKRFIEVCNKIEIELWEWQNSPFLLK